MKRWGSRISMGVLVLGSAVSIVAWQRSVWGAHVPRDGQPPAQAAAKPTIIPDTPLNARLVEAVLRGDLEAIRGLIEQGASADTRVGWSNQEGSAPVALMASRNLPDEHDKYLPIFQLLIQHVTQPNAANESGDTLLMAAVDMDDLDSVKRLVAKGADVNAKMKQFFVGANALYFAASQGGITGKDPSPITLFLLAHKAEVNGQTDRGETPLIEAAQFGKIETVKALLAHGADPSLRNKLGLTALRMASLRHHTAIVALLSDPTTMSFAEAVQFGKIDRILACLKAGENPNGLNEFGLTPLGNAMKSGSSKVTRLLLDHGANVQGVDKRGYTALHYAALYGNTPLALLLLDRGADINATSPSPTVGMTSTPLICAVQQAQADMADLLLRRGADLKKHEQGTMALELAIRTAGQTPQRPRESPAPLLRDNALLTAQDRIIERLLAAGADPRANHSRSLYLAAEHGQQDLVSLLLQKGADVNGRDATGTLGSANDGQTALMGAIEAWSGSRWEQKGLKDGTLSGPEEKDLKAAEAEARKTVNLLLAKGADVNAADSRGQTPLMQCLSDDRIEMARILIQKQADVNAADKRGRAALMQACASDEPDCVDLLLTHSANVNKRDNEGFTALMLAIDDGSNAEAVARRKEQDDHLRNSHGENPPPMSRKDLPNPDGHPDIVRRLLLQHGIDVNIVAANGSTALKLAQKNKFEPVVEMLHHAGAR